MCRDGEKVWLAIAAGSVIDPRGIMKHELNLEIKAIGLVVKSLDLAKPFEAVKTVSSGTDDKKA
jgi:hypothetical protein